VNVNQHIPEKLGRGSGGKKFGGITSKRAKMCTSKRNQEVLSSWPSSNVGSCLMNIVLKESKTSLSLRVRRDKDRRSTHKGWENHTILIRIQARERLGMAKIHSKTLQAKEELRTRASKDKQCLGSAALTTTKRKKTNPNGSTTAMAK